MPLPESRVTTRKMGGFEMSVYLARKRTELIDAVIREVAKLPDRTSPADQPEMMLVTADELRTILTAQMSLMPSSR